MSVGLIAKKVFVFPLLIIVHTIKVSLGINGDDYEDGTYGGFFPEGLAYATVGGAVIIPMIAVLVGWRIPTEERGGFDTFMFASILYMVYLFVFSLFVFPAVRWYLQIHFPRGNWFYLPRIGRAPYDK